MLFFATNSLQYLGGGINRCLLASLLLNNYQFNIVIFCYSCSVYDLCMYVFQNRKFRTVWWTWKCI